MSFSKAAVLDGFTAIFSLDENDDLAISNMPYGTIPFSIFMTSQERQTVVTGLATSNFITKEVFFTSLRNENHNTEDDAPVIEGFSSESYDFMEYLQGLGLPLPIAAQTAYLTDLYSTTTSRARRESFEKFRSNLHAVKQIQTGDYLGLITFAPYFLISSLSGDALASKASRRVDDDPQKLMAILKNVLKFQGGIISENVSSMQFNILMDFMADDAIVHSVVKDDGRISKFIIDILLSDFDWSAAAAYAASSVTPGEGSLDRELLAFIRTTITNKVSVNDSLKGLIGILKAKFSPEHLKGALKVLELNSKVLSYGNAEHFIAFVTIADYLSTGGHIEDPIDWMVSMEPALIVDSFFERVYIAQQK